MNISPGFLLGDCIPNLSPAGDGGGLWASYDSAFKRYDLLLDALSVCTCIASSMRPGSNVSLNFAFSELKCNTHC